MPKPTPPILGIFPEWIFLPPVSSYRLCFLENKMTKYTKRTDNAQGKAII